MNVAGIVVLLAGVCAFAVARAETGDPTAALSGPVTVETVRGETFVGQALEVDAAGILLRVPVDAGTMERTVPREDVARLRLPGETLKPLVWRLLESGARGEALRLVDALFAQRLRFLPYPGEGDAAFFVATLPFYRESDRILEALGRIELLRPHASSAPDQRRMEEEALLGYHLLDAGDEARRRAEEWIRQAGRSPRSALGAVVLAQHQIRDGAWEAALFTVLHPLVLARGRPVEHLEHAYFLAIELADRLGEAALADRLRDDRREQGLASPDSWEPFPPTIFDEPPGLSLHQ